PGPEISGVNEEVYRSFISPWVRAMATPWSAAALEWMHPMRVSRYMFSASANPWMKGVEPPAALISERHEPLSRDNPFKAAEAVWFGQITDLIEAGRKIRDAWAERTF